MTILKDIYNIADVSCVPSRREPFGLVAAEAMACGTPVIATNEGGLPDFINEKVGILVPVDDSEKLALAVKQVISGEKVYLNEINAVPGSLAYYLFTDTLAGFKDILTELIGVCVKEFSESGTLQRNYDSGILRAIGGKSAKRL